jgi:hypothetical protein
MFVNCDVWDHYGDIGHYFIVQDAPSFIQKYVMLIHGWLLFRCGLFATVIVVLDVFLDSSVLAPPGSYRAHHDIRLKKSADNPLSSVIKM